MLLFDPAAGRPLCIIDGNAITTARTAAAGALGLSLLARRDSAVATVFGTGIQAKAQLAFALGTLPSLTHVNYVSSDRGTAGRLRSFVCGTMHVEMRRECG